jgi:hypothetical protein
MSEHKALAKQADASAPAAAESAAPVPVALIEHPQPLAGLAVPGVEHVERQPAERGSVLPALRRKMGDPPPRTGLPDNLKSGVESLSGLSMDHVRVHYQSDNPAALNAHAYAQGSEIHVGPGREEHLAHEAWHVIQQAQGRVRPTMQL